MSDRPGNISPLVELTVEQRREILRELNRTRSTSQAVFDWMRSVTVALLLFFVIRSFLVEAFKIPTGSMENTLLVGDFLLVNKAVYGAEVPLTGKRLPAFEQPQRGDIIVFEWPKDRSKNFVKRIIGIPGDTLEMRNGEVWRNGHPLQERYVLHTEPGTDRGSEEFSWQRDWLIRRATASSGDHPSRNNWGPLIVPESNYFVLGDNRDNSYDSRYWGFVPDSLVKGKPLFVYYSYERGGERRFPWFTNVRWTRVGEPIR
ncbi:MAG TPA: signal peptidase I [Gemmatimonadaceae bacterium]|nr:signal peptidase I [Gemmatimonadaceae bacterium]